MATPAFRLWSAYVCPRPLTSPLDVTPRVQDIGCLRTRGFYCGQCLGPGRERRGEARWGIEFQSIVNLTPGRVFPWSDVYSWFASSTPNTWTDHDKQKEVRERKLNLLKRDTSVKQILFDLYFNTNTTLADTFNLWSQPHMTQICRAQFPHGHMSRIIDIGERRCWEVQ